MRIVFPAEVRKVVIGIVDGKNYLCPWSRIFELICDR